MMRYVLDTNVILHYLKDSPTRKLIEERFDPFGNGNEAIISVVTVAEIGSHPIKAYKGSSRNMGKNDLWIAATTLVAEAELITTDKDFVHLNDDFMRVNLVNM